MFGSTEGLEGKMEHLVKKGAFDKLRSKYLKDDDETVIKLAKVCATSDSDDSVNLVLAMLDRSDAVKMEALKTLAVIGTDHISSTLQLLYSKTPESNTELRKAVLDTLHTIRQK